MGAAPPPTGARRGDRRAVAMRRMGPGIAAGIADDDPSAIGTFSQIGAAFGFAFVWAPLLALPIIAAAQVTATNLGYVTRRGLGGIAVRRMPRVLVAALFLPIVVASSFTVGADLHAMAAAAHLVVAIPEWLVLVALTAATLLLQIFVPYRRYRWVLQWLALSILAYLAALAAMHIDWASVGDALATPDVSLSRSHITALIAVFGAAVSPYFIVWQASSEVEESILAGSDDRRERTLRSARVDAVVGVVAAMAAAFAIVIVTGATLHQAGIQKVESAAQAARALEPLAGSATKLLFAVGILGTGLLAVPVLAGGAAFLVAETFGWRRGLGRPARDAPGFYVLLAAGTLSGLVFGVVGVPAVRALYVASILNGLATPGLLLALFWLGRSRSVLGSDRIGPLTGGIVLIGALLSGALPILFLVVR